jgi:hypothetical protein
MASFVRVLFALLLAACRPTDTGTAQPSSTLPIDRAVASSSVWDDGLAEVATYASRRPIYGEPRTYDYIMITVKEDFNTEFLTKTDHYDRNDLLTVLKVNLFARIPTQNYPYHFLTSLFVRRDAPDQLVKATASSSEWCGNTFKNITATDSAYHYKWDSYWDGEGVGSRSLDRNAFLEDHLFILVRCLAPSTIQRLNIRLYPSITTSKAALAAAEKAVLQASRDILDPAMLDEGAAYGRTECIRYDVTTPTRVLRYWVANDSTRTLLRFEASDGRSMVLTSRTRSAYWNH